MAADDEHTSSAINIVHAAVADTANLREVTCNQMLELDFAVCYSVGLKINVIYHRNICHRDFQFFDRLNISLLMNTASEKLTLKRQP